MKISAFCAWGNGPDVGLDINSGGVRVLVELSANEAEALCDSILHNVRAARVLSAKYEEYMAQNKEAPASEDTEAQLSFDFSCTE